MRLGIPRNLRSMTAIGCLIFSVIRNTPAFKAPLFYKEQPLCLLWEPECARADNTHPVVGSGHSLSNTTVTDGHHLFDAADKNESTTTTQHPPTHSNPAIITHPSPENMSNLTNETNSPTPLNHPHAGARDGSGRWEFIADVTAVRRYMMQKQYREHRRSDVPDGDVNNTWPSFTYLPFQNTTFQSEPNEFDAVCGVPPKKGSEGENGWELLQKVRVDIASPVTETLVSLSDPEDSMKSKMNDTTITYRKILCIIYTHETAHYRVTSIVETWGWRCDGFFAASTRTQMDDPTAIGFGAVDLPHKGEEAYGNMWQKTRSILGYLYDNYLPDFDYFYISGDDTHLIVENLRHYLGSLESQYDVDTKPMYIGQKIFWYNVVFHGGGSGYVLNRVALKRLVEESLLIHFPRTTSPAEDVYVGISCAKLGIDPIDSADDRGQQRFHGKTPRFLAEYKGSNGFFKKQCQYWAKDHGWKIGHDLVSERSIAFHQLKTAILMKRHHAILYRETCPSNSILGNAQRQQVHTG